MPSIPDRWLSYTPVGKVIPGTRILAFKVPLNSQIVSNLDQNVSLDVDKLLQEVPNLGLVIDLTNTQRYYKPESLISKGVDYVKIPVPGHQIPRQSLKNRFITVVRNFSRINRNNDKLIGVHCTHGVNRTGFMICSYLVTMLNFAARDAIELFETARGHKIERRNYCEAIRDDVRKSVRRKFRKHTRFHHN